VRPAGFVADGERWTCHGALTLENAQRIVDAAAGLALPASGEIDLAGVDDADSSALAVLLEIKRRALREGRAVAFRAMPASIVALARVYGIETLVDA
jgi:phospholipid transport system transporter-binding protein